MIDALLLFYLVFDILCVSDLIDFLFNFLKVVHVNLPVEDFVLLFGSFIEFVRAFDSIGLLQVDQALRSHVNHWLHLDGVDGLGIVYEQFLNALSLFFENSDVDFVSLDLISVLNHSFVKPIFSNFYLNPYYEVHSHFSIDFFEELALRDFGVCDSLVLVHLNCLLAQCIQSADILTFS